ncbi:MAG: 30S ribosomal protein S6 [Chloroflexi bacterium]|jgi:small subunit ribosomal protein S6|nr:MAG: 30S ribosomal protein S6 [Chloroflexota bacterium]
MRRYELMLLLRPDLEDDKLQSAVEKVTRAIVNAGGSLSKVSPWGKRRLAYPIQHLREASYFLIHFDVEPNAVREIERGLLLSEEIVRHLVTVIEDRGPAGEEIEAVPPADRDEDVTPEDDSELEDVEESAEDAEIDADEPEEPAARAATA